MERRTETPGYRTQSPDTDEWAERLQFAHWRSMELWQKAQLVSDLCNAAHRLHLRGLRDRHPAATDEELELRAACARIGRDNVEAVLGRKLPFDDVAS